MEKDFQRREYMIIETLLCLENNNCTVIYYEIISLNANFSVYLFLIIFYKFYEVRNKFIASHYHRNHFVFN